MEFFVFGDSIAYGSFDNDGGWATRIHRFIEEKINAPDAGDYYHHFYNLSIPAENTVRTLARFDGETAARLIKYKDACVVLALGTNDCNWLIEEKRTRVSAGEYEQNLRELAGKAEGINARVIFVGLLIADEARVNPVSWAPEKAYVNEYIREYDAIMRRVAEDVGADYIDVATPFIAAGGASLLDDGIHPNGEGHRIIYETVRDALVAMKLI